MNATNAPKGLPDSPQGPPPVPAPSGPEPLKRSGLAVASLVLGVLSWVTCGIMAIPGVICGTIALVKIQKKPPQRQGANLAIAGICVSGAALLLVPVMAAMLLPALAKARQKALTVQCMNNVKLINMGLILYADNNGGRLPPADRWCDLIQPYTRGTTSPFHCAAQPPGRCSYALNANVAGQKLPDSNVTELTKLVVVFSSTEGWNQAGSPETATPHNHGAHWICAGFADGHVEVLRAPPGARSP